MSSKSGAEPQAAAHNIRYNTKAAEISKWIGVRRGWAKVMERLAHFESMGWLSASEVEEFDARIRGRVGSRNQIERDMNVARKKRGCGAGNPERQKEKALREAMRRARR